MSGHSFPRYQQQASQQTLTTALEEYYATYGGYFKDRKMSAEAESFFACHDVAHVVFGCGISLPDELVVKMCSLFGTTEGFGVMKGYRLAESREGYAELAPFDVVLTTLKSIVLVPRSLWRCWQQTKRWEWYGFEAYQEHTLADIREEFGIRVVR